jgi:TetR/AcrR family transcriptional repressor of nem operon
MGRTSDAREKILRAAETLMELRGYSALSVADICRAAGVPKGSFYYFFESKEALAIAVLDEHWTTEEHAWQQALSSDATPLNQLQELFSQTAAEQRAGQQNCGSVSGCMFGNLTLELSNQTEGVRKRLQEIFEAQVILLVYSGHAARLSSSRVRWLVRLWSSGRSFHQASRRLRATAE